MRASPRDAARVLAGAHRAPKHHEKSRRQREGLTGASQLLIASSRPRDGKTTITLNMNDKGGMAASMAWIVYSGVHIQWQKEEFKKH